MQESIYPIIIDEHDLPFVIYGIGYKKHQHRIYRENGLSVYQLMYTRSGNGILNLSGRNFSLDKNHVAFLQKDMPHEYYPTGEEWSMNWITFSGTAVEQTIQKLILSDNPVIPASDINIFEHIFGQMIKSIKSGNKYSIYKCSHLILEFLTEMHISAHAPVDYNKNHIDKILEYIDCHFTDDIQLYDLAEVSRLTPEHLCSLFKKSMNMRIFEYIAKKRIQKAKAMLVNTNMPINVIAKEVGYMDKSYFGHVFKKHENISPSEFRGKS